MTAPTDTGTEYEISSRTYNERDELSRNRIGNNQDVDYAYNLRKWLTDINNTNTCTTTDLFSLKLNYHIANADVGSTALYNGNISSIEWRTGANCLVNSVTRNKAVYGFNYDNDNRLLSARYGEYNSSNAWQTGSVDRYTVDNISYDDNGNLKTIRRKGQTGTGVYGTIDDLSYTYSPTIPNRLMTISEAAPIDRGFKKVSPTAGGYDYSSNGNVTIDGYRGITLISYNPLNLPSKINYSASQYIEYTYDASGRKWKSKTVNGATTTEKTYLGEIEYLGSNLQAIYHAEGRAVPSGSVYEYQYVIKDHLGNTRVTFKVVSGTATLLEEMHYYPFGMNMEGFTGGTYPYRYNSKELQTDLDLRWYDYGARWYDPSVGRWNAVDPKAVEMPAWSSYSYSFNNPILFIDPDGQKPVPISSTAFRQYAQGMGLSGNQQIGAYFERLAIASLQTTRPVIHNTTQDFFSPVRQRMNGGLPASVRPDGISAYVGASSRGEIFVSPSFYEAKATGATISKRYRKGQITGMIDALANMDRRPDELASLTLVTTSNTKISADILNYATSRNVVVFQSVAALDDETGEFILSEKTLLNGNLPSTIIDQLRKINGSYDEFKGIDPSLYLYGNNPGPADPDPAEIDDH